MNPTIIVQLQTAIRNISINQVKINERISDLEKRLTTKIEETVAALPPDASAPLAEPAQPDPALEELRGLVDGLQETIAGLKERLDGLEAPAEADAAVTAEDAPAPAPEPAPKEVTVSEEEAKKPSRRRATTRKTVAI